MSMLVPSQRPVQLVAAGEDRGAIGELHQRPVDSVRQDDGLGEKRPGFSQSISGHGGLQGRTPSGPGSENDFKKNALRTSIKK